MTIQTAIILPLVLIIIFSLIIAIAFMVSHIFYEHEDGVSFLIALQDGSSFNGFKGRGVKILKKARLTGVEYYKISTTGKQFSVYKANRLIFGALEELMGK